MSGTVFLTRLSGNGSLSIWEDQDELRMVERNALRAELVERAEDWRWCSLHRWKRGTGKTNGKGQALSGTVNRRGAIEWWIG